MILSDIMPRKELKYSFYGATDVGQERTCNEDALLMNEAYGLFAVADGVGGLLGGDIASDMALTELEKSVLLCQNYQTVNFNNIFHTVLDAVNEHGESICDKFGIATTLTAVRVNGKSAKIGHVGDSGLVVFRGNEYKKITEDHTIANQIRAECHENETINLPEYYTRALAQCIGLVKDFNPQATEISIEKGDRILLYTDGLTKEMTFGEIHQIVDKSETPREAIRKLIKTANDRGASDNVTAILIFAD